VRQLLTLNGIQRLTPPAHATRSERSLDERSGGPMASETRPARRSSTRVAGVVRRYAGLVWRIVRRGGLRPADAEDATQDVLWIFAQRADSVPPESEKAFLVTTALRVAADRRRTRWHRSVTEPLDPEMLDARAESPEQASEHLWARALLDEALDALDADARAVFVLMELEQMTREEAAALLGIAAGTVASRMRRARESFDAVARRIRLREPRRAP
jgi:RNA polymerase sigma-70 factor (ECF subfamily)